MIYSEPDEGHSMRGALLALTVMVALFVAAIAYARESQPCIRKATEALPHVSGLGGQTNVTGMSIHIGSSQPARG
jgi:hypothetical protein